ncbi:CAP domain-containing protein [Burkholderia sp. JKS000303]|uniref:CAP domain-containing protein n=1 Tax=Burkholderia sp. JKS000303 TaxID=1938747 RepID=UPI000C00D029|nr:CAP domain-containing protein [Burkholderia sp. JKS000303]PFH19035.1 uncharacterized protein YkwD [Burkholderia sp. JKS000303]
MKISIALKACGVAVLLTGLAACGGGGGASDGQAGQASTGTGSVANTPASLVPVAAVPVTYSPVGDVAIDSIGFLNALRQTIGLRVLPQNAAIARAAQNHADYMVANGVNGHYEIAGRPGFTGIDPQSRIAALYPSGFTGEVNIVLSVSGPSASNGIDSLLPIHTLIDAPFHRIVMLSDFGATGVAVDTNFVPGAVSWAEALNIDFADNAKTLGSNHLVAYPYDGQTGISTTWVANENPNPLNDVPQFIGANVGYPVTLQGASTDKLSIRSFLITSQGTNVPCQLVDPDTASIGAELHGAAVCTPLHPLQAGAPYTATVSGIRNGQPFTVDWSWTTAS